MRDNLAQNKKQAVESQNATTKRLIPMYKSKQACCRTRQRFVIQDNWLSLYLWNDFLWCAIKLASKLGKIIYILSMFELFHIFLLFYLLFSEQYACGIWKSQDLYHLSKKKQWGESSIFHIHNSTIISSLFFFLVFFQNSTYW